MSCERSAAMRHSSRRFSSMVRIAAASAFRARISSFSRPMRVTGLYSAPSRSARLIASRSIAFARYPRCLVGSSSSPLSALLRWLTRSPNPFLSRAALTQSAHSLRRSTSSSRPAFLASLPSGLTIAATGFLLFRSALSRPSAHRLGHGAAHAVLEVEHLLVSLGPRPRLPVGGVHPYLRSARLAAEVTLDAPPVGGPLESALAQGEIGFRVRGRGGSRRRRRGCPTRPRARSPSRPSRRNPSSASRTRRPFRRVPLGRAMFSLCA